MDAKNMGNTIAELRRKQGLTQLQLAQKLNISDKAVSRWETGLGFPEITLLPALASVLGVAVDYLLTGSRKGITVAGNIITDIVKTIDCYPKAGMLTRITSIKQAVGGCAPNTAIDLAKIDSSLPVSVIGKIGDDEYGRFIVSQMSYYGIDCSRISVSSQLPTSFSDVMSQASGERTFFHARGSNTDFSPEDINLGSITSCILHIGYILLLEAFDKEDPEYGTVMARFLHDAQAKGIKTSVDVVSDSTPDYRSKVLPALKYCNYVIVNEIESSMLSGLDPYTESGDINIENIKQTMIYMAECGVKEKVIVHCKKAGFCYDVASGNFTVSPSLKIPEEDIKGSVGAGDAFAAGCLYGIYNNYDDKHILEFAAAAAACNLFAENSVDGMRSADEIEAISKKYSRLTI